MALKHLSHNVIWSINNDLEGQCRFDVYVNNLHDEVI